MGSILSAGPYPHNPLMGDRPMKYPYTKAAKLAQFPVVYHWRYSVWFKPMSLGLIIVYYINYKIEKMSHTPAKIEDFKQLRKEWYTRKYPPEYDLY